MQTSALRLADGPRLDGVRVLVVNDMRSVRQVVTDILECAGATVTAVDFRRRRAGSAATRASERAPQRPLDAGGAGRLLADRAGSRTTAGARWHHPRRRPHRLHGPLTPRPRAACVGRPPVNGQGKGLVMRIAAANPLWGAPTHLCQSKRVWRGRWFIVGPFLTRSRERLREVYVQAAAVESATVVMD